MRFRPFCRLAAVVLLSVACGGSGSTAPSSNGPTVAGAITTIVVTTTEVTLTNLIGIWENDDLRLEVNEGGEYVIRDPTDPAMALMGGFVARDGDRFSFVTATGGECPGRTGVYAARIEGEMLSLTLVQDPCEVRATGFDAALQRGG